MRTSVSVDEFNTIECDNRPLTLEWWNSSLVFTASTTTNWPGFIFQVSEVTWYCTMWSVNSW